MTTPINQKLFTAGEVDVTVWKRTDMEAYMQAAQSLLNATVGTTGLARKRAGTTFAVDVTSCAIPQSRIFEFVDKNGNGYVVLAANQKFCIYGVTGVSEQEFVVTHDGTQVITLRGNDVVAGGLVDIEDITADVNGNPIPYLAADLAALDYSLDNDVLVFAHPKYPPARLYISNYSPLTFSYQPLVSIIAPFPSILTPLPAFDFNNVNYSNYTVSGSLPGTSVVFTNPTGQPTGFTDDWVGGVLIAVGANPTQPLGYGYISSLSGVGTSVTTFNLVVQIPFGSIPTAARQWSVQQPAWSNALGWPACVLFYQSRLWFANTDSLPDGIFGSKINNPLNFDIGVGGATDAIVYVLGINGAGQINWLNAGKQLEIFMERVETTAPQDQNLGLTPATFAVKQQTSFGSSGSFKPQVYLNDTYYLSRTGTSIQNFHFDGVGLSYSASNISLASQHLVKNPINRALVQGDDISQDNFIYFLNPDSTITTFQFASEYKLAALTPMEFNHRYPAGIPNPYPVSVLDIASVNNQAYILKTYPNNGNYTLEFIDNTVKMDCVIASSMNSAGIITGLDELNGYQVQVLFNGQDYGHATVAGGTITVANPLGLSGQVQVGILYDVVITPMYMFGGANESDYFKSITRIFVDYYQSLNFYINGTLVPYQTFAQVQAQMPPVPITDTAIISPVLGYNRFFTFSITQTAPFDLQILGIMYQIDAAIV